MKPKSPTPKRWRPKAEQLFWYVDIDGRITGYMVKKDVYLPADPADKFRIKLGNCYRTKKEAIQALKRVLKALKGQ